MLEQKETEVNINEQNSTLEEHFNISDFAKLAGVTRKTIYCLLDSDLKPYIYKGARKTLISKNALHLFGKSLEGVNNNKVIELEKEISAKDSDIQRYKAIIAEIREDKINAIESLNNDINRLENRIKALDEQLKLREELLAEKEKLIMQQEEHATRQEGIIATLNSEMAKQNSKIVYLENRKFWDRLTNKKNYTGLLTD